MREALAAEHPAVPDYRRNLAVSHNSVGNLLEQTGELAGALAEQRRYQELMRALAAEHPEVPDYRRELAVSHNWVGDLLEKTGDVAGALTEQRRYQELMRALAAEHPEVPDYRREPGRQPQPGRRRYWRRPATWPGRWPSSGGTRS